MSRTRLWVVTAAVVLTSSGAASAQSVVTSTDQKSSLRLGLLGQFQAEWLETADTTAFGKNLFLRRARLLFEARHEKLTVFVDTDSPNIGKGGTDGKKHEGTLYIQDFVVTYAAKPNLMLDGGMLLLPLAYNGGQSAAALVGVDYGPHSFVASAPTQSRLGRDYGVQARGYLLGQHLEARGGLFQGVRGADGTNGLRTYGRLAYHVLDEQMAFFHPGTSLGKQRRLDVGVSFDRQEDYQTVGGDVFADYKLGGGKSVTAQVDHWRIDGGEHLTSLPEQRVWFAEAGLFFPSLKLQPYVQYSRRNYVAEGSADDSFFQAGLAYFADGHRLNLKLGAGRVGKTGAESQTQVVAQAQVLFW